MNLKIHIGSIKRDNLSNEIRRYPESVIITISAVIEDQKTNLGKFIASIKYKNHVEYYQDYIGHAHSAKTAALYAILLGMAKLKRPVDVVVFWDLAIADIRDSSDKSIYDQIDEMAQKKEVKSLTMIAVQDGDFMLKQLSTEPDKPSIHNRKKSNTSNSSAEE